MTDLEIILMCVAVFLYFNGLVLSVAAARSENARGHKKITFGPCLLWFVAVTYACVTINKGRGQ